MKKLLLLLVAVLTLSLGLKATEIKEYDFTPNTNKDKWPTLAPTKETTYTSKTHPELTLTFFEAKWVKNTSNSNIATTKRKSGYVKIAPFEGKIVTKVQLYLPAGVTTKSKFDLFIDGNEEAIGQFTTSQNGAYFNEIEIPANLQSKDNVLVIKTANPANQCGFGKIKFTFENANIDPAKVVTSVVIAPEACEFEGEKAVTLTAYNADNAAIEGAEILYTLNNGEQQTGTSPVTLNLTETTTVKAWAKNVEPVEATFTKVIPAVKPEKPIVTVKGDVKEGDFEVVEGTEITVFSENAISLKENCTDATFTNPYTFIPTAGEEIYEFVGINGEYTSEPAKFVVTVKAPVIIARTATYDFTVDKAYGLNTQTGTSQTYETTVKSIPSGSATINFENGAKYRHWESNTGYELRIMKNGGSFEVSVTDDCHITSIEFNGTINLTTTTADVEKTDDTFSCTTDNVKVVKFDSSDNSRTDIQTITVKYMKSIDPADQPAAPTLNHNVEAKTIEISHEDAECTYEYRFEMVNGAENIQAYANEAEYKWIPVKGNFIDIADAQHPVTTLDEKLNFYVRAVKNDIHGEATSILNLNNDGISTGIADVELDNNGEVEYFNLQGVRVAEPVNGLYLRRSGNRVEKVVVR